MRNQRVIFFTDDAALVYVINKQPCKDKDLVLVCLSHNTLFGAKHIPGIHNDLADALTRFRFRPLNDLRQLTCMPLTDCNSTAPAASQLATIVSTFVQSSSQPSSGLAVF